jgi:cytochrome P450
MRFYNFPLTAAEATAVADPMERDHYSYGAGRRICPGMHIAERSLFINLARLCWGFDIRHAKDDEGNEIPVDATFKGMLEGATATPRPFKCGMDIPYKSIN